MMKRLALTIPLCLLALGLLAQGYVAGHSEAREEVLRSIPTQYIDAAREGLVIAYQHTSHGTHVSRGSYGLPGFKSGDDVLFGISTSAEAGKLEFRDNALRSYAAEGVDASDLSRNETAFIQATRNFLDADENADVNVVMWSWCNIAGHDVAGNYLPGMESLISEYGEGGSKIGNGAGQRAKPVHFIFMTGHANANSNTGSGEPKAQAALINDYCNDHRQFCLDYYSIDTHDMEGNYWEDAGDNGQSSAYGGNFYEDWQNSHSLGEDYFYARSSPGGEVRPGSHNTQHITANRKAFAFWWILARIAGWDGGAGDIPVSSIAVSSPGGVTTVEEGGTLQLSATVLPANASDPTVSWSVENGTGSANISATGELSAISAGTVRAIARANDGSGVSGELEIVITSSSTGIAGRDDEPAVLVYPNPGDGVFHVDCRHVADANYRVIRSDGLAVLEGNLFRESLLTIDLSGFPDGVYCLHIYEEMKDSPEVHKLIKM